MTDERPIIRLESIARSYDGGAIVALRSATLSIYPGETLAIVGPSGSGKSTLLHVIGGIERPTEGVVRWKDEIEPDGACWARLRGSEIGHVFQDFLLLPALSALQNVICAVGSKTPRHEARSRATDALARVGLSGRAHHLPNALSGGERQRVAIARSLVNRPRILLADEPTGSLDSENAAAIVDLLFALQETDRHALVLVTHDPALAHRCARRIAMRDGMIVSDVS